MRDPLGYCQTARASGSVIQRSWCPWGETELISSLQEKSAMLQQMAWIWQMEGIGLLSYMLATLVLFLLAWVLGRVLWLSHHRQCHRTRRAIHTLPSAWAT